MKRAGLAMHFLRVVLTYQGSVGLAKHSLVHLERGLASFPNNTNDA